jgi:hypothetical protein
MFFDHHFFVASPSLSMPGWRIIEFNLPKLLAPVNKKITNTCYFFIDIIDPAHLNNRMIMEAGIKWKYASLWGGTRL